MQRHPLHFQAVAQSLPGSVAHWLPVVTTTPLPARAPHPHSHPHPHCARVSFNRGEVSFPTTVNHSRQWLCCLDAVRTPGITLPDARGTGHCQCDPSTPGSPSDDPDAVEDALAALADAAAEEQDNLETLFGDFHTFTGYESDGL